MYKKRCSRHNKNKFSKYNIKVPVKINEDSRTKHITNVM